MHFATDDEFQSTETSEKEFQKSPTPVNDLLTAHLESDFLKLSFDSSNAIAGFWTWDCRSTLRLTSSEKHPGH
ncbi:hypothetical protein BGAL_0144g00250 [Botrytis galanthina]|uniref:Uncharacterized protein n=1 Tax=Botrytis galanthina TaxID=278940 RepID=A0A4S8R0X4_9HELO|nr:hypothetical protein BGAL_0144g00250 [Botrytis galanthina]